MSAPFVGEIRLFGGNFAPSGHALCNGQILAISQNTALFSLLGTQYGGDGKANFALPDLRGRIPVGVSATHPLGEASGSETVVLTSDQMPAHSHTWPVRSAANTAGLEKGGVPSDSIANGYSAFNSGPPDATLAGGTTALTPAVQSGAGHPNMAPYLVVTFIIALQGVFPARG